ncbi:hypothetical protein KCU81_g5587, partial [Aureobasidium melanogenum]
MMRQRGAGARSIPTNFGFIFHAGPIQVSDTTAIESPSPSNTRPIALAHTQIHHHSESSLPSHVPAPKRKRVVREEEDDQIWFKKRTKKTTFQEQKEDTILAAALDASLDVTQQEPPAANKPTKRKVKKRVLVPRPRQKDSLKPQPDQPISLPKPVVEDIPQPKRKTKSDQDPQDVCLAEKARKKALPPKRVVRKHVQENIETAQSSPKESTQTITTLPLKEKSIDKKPKAKTTRQQNVTKKHLEKPLEEQIAKAPVDAQQDPTQEGNSPPKRKKLVRRVRVPRATAKRATAKEDDLSNTVNNDDTNPLASTNETDLVLSEAVAPAPIPRKPSKTPKRIFFNDDSDIDLDQMLSGIAAIAESKGDTRITTSKSSLTAKKKIAA